MSTLCRQSSTGVIFSLLMLVGIVLYACGGGSDDESDSGPSPNVPSASSWERFDVIKLEGDQPINPNIKALMDDQGQVHIFYYKRGDTYDGNQVRYQINHVVWDATDAALIGDEEMLDVRPPNTGGGDSGLNNCLLLDAALTTNGSPVAAYQGGRIPQAEDGTSCNYIDQGDLMVNLFSNTDWAEYLGIQGDASPKNPYFTDGYVGIAGSIAIDGQNSLHMAAQHYFEFCDWTSQNYPDLIYVKQTIDQLGHYSTSMEELVDDYNVYGGGGGIQSNMGNGCKLVLDANDNPVIFYIGTPYQDGSGEDRTSLRMSRKIGDQWQTPEIVDVLEGWEVESLSAAIAPNGTIGVAYFMEEVSETNYPDHLRYAFRQSDGQWEVDIVDISSHCGDFNALAFDDGNRPLIAYYDIHANTGSYRPREDLRFARLENGRWVKETVATAGDIGKYNSIWLDASNVIYICTYEFNEQQIVIFRERTQ